MTTKMKIFHDILILFLFIAFISINILVIKTTDQLYFKTFAFFVTTLLSTLGLLWLLVIILAVIIAISVRIGLAKTVRIGSDITKQMEEKFLVSDFDRWEVEKFVILRRIQKEVLCIYFLADVFNAKQDISRVSRFLYFWKEVQIRVHLIIDMMNKIDWDERRLTAQNYVTVMEALRQLDTILRDPDYWNEKFQFLTEDIVKQRHRKEFQNLLNDAVVPEDRKQSFVFQLMTKSLITFENNLKENLKKLK